MRFIKRNHFKIILLAAILVVIYNEWLTYYLQTLKWPTLECPNEDGCVKILLVADPQILGEQSENPLLTLIFNLDSDGFLAKTYARVVSYFRPDVVVFLGDLMDEGSYASRPEFYRYVKRIPQIFNTEHPIKHVWIPGDNDIGGENEPIHPEKIKMFEASFNQPDVISVKYVDIYKTNYLTQLLPDSPHSHPSSNVTKVAISHMPLLLTPDRFSANVLTSIQPAVIFSGHRHLASYLEATIDNLFKKNRIKILRPQDDNQVMEIELKPEEFHEFIIPTCSYRMGARDVGYGAAVIDTVNQKIQFAVLWSPLRFYHLKLYLLALIVLCLYLFVLFISKTVALTRTCRVSTTYSKV